MDMGCSIDDAVGYWRHAGSPLFAASLLGVNGIYRIVTTVRLQMTLVSAWPFSNKHGNTIFNDSVSFLFGFRYGWLLIIEIKRYKQLGIIKHMNGKSSNKISTKHLIIKFL